MTTPLPELAPLIEGILFYSTVPLSVEAIGRIITEEGKKPALGKIRQALAALQKEYENRGIELVEVATGYRFQVAGPAMPYVAKTLEEKPARFSRALLETLALIAYRQPITRGEIEDIRGVVVSTNIIKTLDELEWIRIVGYKEVPGKPGLYATTKTFLDHFGLKSLEELPPLAALEDFANIMPSPEQLDAKCEENLEENAQAIEATEAIEVPQESAEADIEEDIEEDNTVEIDAEVKVEELIHEE
jgi:segregation and condensation protein B